MGQYHNICNFTKKEYIRPSSFGFGPKQLEQIGPGWGTGDLLFLLLSCSNDRGGGDAELTALTRTLLGRWVGDVVVVVGDYTEDEDIPKEVYDGPASKLWTTIHASGSGWTEISNIIRPGFEEIQNNY